MLAVRQILSIAPQSSLAAPTVMSQPPVTTAVGAPPAHSHLLLHTSGRASNHPKAVRHVSSNLLDRLLIQFLPDSDEM